MAAKDLCAATSKGKYLSVYVVGEMTLVYNSHCEQPVEILSLQIPTYTDPRHLLCPRRIFVRINPEDTGCSHKKRKRNNPGSPTVLVECAPAAIFNRPGFGGGS